MPFSSGFTLIELTIVIAIISLLAGGIMIASEVIGQSAMKATITQISGLQSAVSTFRDQFNALPGDMHNATDFWGVDGSGCPAGAYDGTVKQATCNGNGNGRIGEAYPAEADTGEWYRAWQHLANAGLIEGQFTGMQGNVSAPAGVDIPSSRYPGGAYLLRYNDQRLATADTFIVPPGHYLEFGAISSACASGGDCGPHQPLIKPTEALDLDRKLDDARPGTGRILARPQGAGATPDCVSGTDAESATYNTNGTQLNACAVMVGIGL